MSELGFLIDVSIIIISFILLYKYKYNISSLFKKVPIRNIFILAIFSSIPFIFVEESINCIDYNDGLGCRMTTWINIVLILEVSILLYIVKNRKISSIKKPLTYFSLFGLSWELLFGGLKGILFSHFIFFMAPYIMLSYAYIALIPLTIYLSQKEVNS